MRKFHEPEEIVEKLRVAEARMGDGARLDAAAALVGVAPEKLALWRRRYKGLSAGRIAYLKALERKTAELRETLVRLEGGAPLPARPRGRCR